MASKKKSTIAKSLYLGPEPNVTEVGHTGENERQDMEDSQIQEQQPEYSLNWVVQLNYRDKMGQHTLGTYSNSVMTDTLKLMERACTMAGQQMFQKIVEDTAV